MVCGLWAALSRRERLPRAWDVEWGSLVPTALLCGAGPWLPSGAPEGCSELGQQAEQAAGLAAAAAATWYCLCVPVRWRRLLLLPALVWASLAARAAQAAQAAAARPGGPAVAAAAASLGLLAAVLGCAVAAARRREGRAQEQRRAMRGAQERQRRLLALTAGLQALGRHFYGGMVTLTAELEVVDADQTADGLFKGGAEGSSLEGLLAAADAQRLRALLSRAASREEPPERLRLTLRQGGDAQDVVIMVAADLHAAEGPRYALGLAPLSPAAAAPSGGAGAGDEASPPPWGPPLAAWGAAEGGRQPQRRASEPCCAARLPEGLPLRLTAPVQGLAPWRAPGAVTEDGAAEFLDVLPLVRPDSSGWGAQRRSPRAAFPVRSSTAESLEWSESTDSCGGQSPRWPTRTLSLLLELGESAGPPSRAAAEAETQTEGPPGREDAAVNTPVAWEGAVGLVCGRCSKPPRPPGGQLAATRCSSGCEKLRGREAPRHRGSRGAPQQGPADAGGGSSPWPPGSVPGGGAGGTAAAGAAAADRPRSLSPGARSPGGRDAAASCLGPGCSAQPPAFDGIWLLSDDRAGRVAGWLRVLRIRGHEVVDGLGERSVLRVKDGATFLELGRLWLEGDVLYRSCNSGDVLAFVRMEAGPYGEEAAVHVQPQADLGP